MLVDHLYEITHIDSREVTLNKLETIEKTSENTSEVNLYQARPNKLSKIEYILQKWVEAGISNFFIYRSERSQELRISNSKQQRLEKIIEEAVEQSNRNIIPGFHITDELEAPVRTWKNIYLHTSQWSNAIKIRDLKVNAGVNIWVGPEGGFSDTEIDSFQKQDYKKLYLGDRVLRTETAWVVVWFFISQLSS